MSGQLTADLLHDLLPLLGREVAPTVALADVLGIDVAGSLKLGSLAVLQRVIGAVAAGIIGLLFLLTLLPLLFELLDHLFQLGDDGILFIADDLSRTGQSQAAAN